ncbi:R.Pab1 family restriction endonuclease [Helicobacter ailurogastricus]|uniref:R.Pab1 family restriction endonuclease n=1 Tax=Helicobacter ailurogastricus TaxID=1578720 RepID=UPI00244D85AC|nr:R.Pab1 family restriction endonuclease [Helicobacter ailurogastricus]GMB91090.1 restriction endonuclease [Helicobacter ailurogastricus]
MWISFSDAHGNIIGIGQQIPLTTQSGKIRVKVRQNPYEYGMPTATRQVPFSPQHYIEWQISYDVDKTDKDISLSTLPEKEFKGANGKTKALYELSEFLYYFVQWGWILPEEIKALKDSLQSMPKNMFLTEQRDLQIVRGYCRHKEIFGLNFQHLAVQYPLLVYFFDSLGILVEIVIREKQRAVGVQPMLYVCIPITHLNTQTPLLGRMAGLKECGSFILGAGHKDFLLELFKIFATLSPNHHHDILQILEVIICTKKT